MFLSVLGHFWPNLGDVSIAHSPLPNLALSTVSGPAVGRSLGPLGELSAVFPVKVSPPHPECFDSTSVRTPHTLPPP